MRLLTIALVGLSVISPHSPASATARASCAATPLVRDTAPPDPGADPGGPADWYINADRSMWAGPVPDGGWPARGTVYSGSKRVEGQKTYWVRPQGKTLVIAGHRVDGAAAPLKADIPCCYTGNFQIVALDFPTEGCWQVSASAGDRSLTFVTEVKAVSALARRYR